MARCAFILVVAILAAAAIPAKASVGTALAPSGFVELTDRAKAQMLADPRAAAKTAERAKAILLAAGPTPKPDDLALAEWLNGEANLRLGNTDQARAMLTRAWSRVEHIRKPSTLKGNILVSLGWIEMENAQFTVALTTFQKAFRIYQKIGDARNEAMALMSIASLYTQANDYDSALKYYSQASDIYKADARVTISLNNNIANIYAQKKDFRAAYASYNKALNAARAIQSQPLQAQILRNIARLQLDVGDSDAADRTIALGLALADRGEDESAKAQFTEIAARAAFQRGDTAHAAVLIAQAIDSVDQSADALSLREAHDVAYKIYKKLGRNDLALTNLETLKRLDDQTASLAASANTALMAARFDYTNQNLKIAKLQAQDLQRRITYERAQARTTRLVFIAAGGVTVVIIAMLVFGIVTIRRSRNEERAAKDALAETNSALARALAAKTEFLATTSHEIRTPLNGILGMTQVMLADPALAAPVRERLGVVHSAGVTMRALVDDILDVAKMETGNMTIEQAPMDVCAVLRDVARIWEDQARARGLAFDLSLDDCPALVIGDAARLRQIVFNLLSNALKFTEAGRITLGGATVDGAGGRRVRITVADTGIGIPPDKLDEVFESFRQADASTTRRFGGTGLGLAICRNLARAMGGDVHVASTPGEGTTFTIDLPLVESAAPIRADAAAGQGAPGDALLIVDRNPITRSMLRALLEERAGAVTFAASLAEAAERLAGGGIALALIDEATARAAAEGWAAGLRAVADAAGAARTAVLWHAPAGDDLEALTASGIGAIIAKPITGPALREALYPADVPGRNGIRDPHLVPDAA